MLKQNLIKNCPITIEHVNNAIDIFGPSISRMKGNSMRKQPKRVIEDIIEIPRELYARSNNVILCIGVFYVYGQAVLSTIDKTVQFGAAIPIEDGTDASHYKALDAVTGCYNKADFYIKTLGCDGEFRSLMDPLQQDMDLEMDYCAPGAHVPEAERNNRSIQDRSRSGFYRMPFKAVPRIMIRYLVMRASRSYNWLPPKGGISLHYSPHIFNASQGLGLEQALRIRSRILCTGKPR